MTVQPNTWSTPHHNLEPTRTLCSHHSLVFDMSGCDIVLPPQPLTVPFPASLHSTHLSITRPYFSSFTCKYWQRWHPSTQPRTQKRTATTPYPSCPPRPTDHPYHTSNLPRSACSISRTPTCSTGPSEACVLHATTLSPMGWLATKPDRQHRRRYPGKVSTPQPKDRMQACQSQTTQGRRPRWIQIHYLFQRQTPQSPWMHPRQPPQTQEHRSYRMNPSKLPNCTSPTQTRRQPPSRSRRRFVAPSARTPSGAPSPVRNPAFSGFSPTASSGAWSCSRALRMSINSSVRGAPPR